MKLYLKPIQLKRYQYFFRKLDSSFFLVGLLIAMSSTTVQAQLIEQTQEAIATSHDMPLSEEVYEVFRDPEKRIEVPAPRIPIGEEALENIKAQTNKSLVAPTTVVPISLDANVQESSQSSGGCPVNSAGNSAPSDIHGAVGSSNLVVVTNTDIGIYNKSTCARLSLESLVSFFSAAGTSGQILFDPRVLYDLSNNRFFVTAESTNNSNNDQYQYMAISKDDSGTSWWLYRIRLSEGSTKWCKSAVDSFWDYPSAGYDKSNWYITANDFGDSVTGAIISIDKSKSMIGDPVSMNCFNSLTFNIQPPIVMDSADSAYFLSPGSGSGNSITRYKFTPSSAMLSTMSPISVSSWTAAQAAKQPNGQKLDTLDGRFQSASIQRGDYLWNVHTVADSDGSSLKFYKFSTTETTPLWDQTIHVYGGSEAYSFNPSTAISPSGQAFVTMTFTSSTYKASMLMLQGSSSSFTGWQVSMLITSSSQFENCSTSRGCRWGDYSSTQIDPSNLGNAWGFNQLADGTTQFDWTSYAGHVSGPALTGFLPAIYYILH